MILRLMDIPLFSYDIKLLQFLYQFMYNILVIAVK